MLLQSAAYTGSLPYGFCRQIRGHTLKETEDNGMISLSLTDIKGFMSQLLLSETFDNFSFIEGEIVTFNTFRIDGFIQKDFFDTEEEPPQYSCWKNLREYCFSIIRGKRTPLSFHLIFSLSPENTKRLMAQSTPALHAEDVQGLYLNIRYDSRHLSCITGTSFKTFTLDKSLEHAWDEMVQKFLRQKKIEFVQES